MCAASAESSPTVPPLAPSTPERIPRLRDLPRRKAPYTSPTSTAIKPSQCENRELETDAENMPTSPETRKFAAEHAQKLLGQLAFEINRVAKSRDPDSVHDLRVSLRRFSQTMHLFRDCFPGRKMHKIELRVKRVMRSADELRNFDTTLRLLSKARRSGSSALRSKLQARRKESERLLAGLLKRWTERKSSVISRTARTAS